VYSAHTPPLLMVSLYKEVSQEKAKSLPWLKRSATWNSFQDLQWKQC